jgi:CBS domain-containing protein
MSPRTASEFALHRPTLLVVDEPVGSAVQRVLDSGLPALPVVDRDERFAGIFGEREFLTAVFPGYLKELRGTRYLRRALDESLQFRDQARTEPVSRHMTTDHVEVDTDFSDVQVAETFLHHRVLVIPVISEGRVDGLITRQAFFRAIAEQLGDRASD